MWRRIELKNYRSIESARVELAPFTVLVGPNGSSKSNFADALVFVSELATASASVARRGGITGIYRWQEPLRGELSIELRTSESEEGLDKSYTRYSGTIEILGDKRWRFLREEFTTISDGAELMSIQRQGDTVLTSTNNGTRLMPIVLSGTASIELLMGQLAPDSSGGALNVPFTRAHRYRLSPDQMRQPHTESDEPFLNESGSNIADAIEQLRSRQDEAWGNVLLSMAQVVPGLRDITTIKLGHFRTLEFSQQQVAGGVASFTAMELSDGALRALGILVAAQQMGPRDLLIIEEPEVHLHPGATAVLFEVLKQASERGAVLITTHSPELLDAARDEEILVCDYRSGVTRTGPLASEQRQVVRDGLFSVAELMRTTPLRIEGDAPAVIDPTQAP